MTSLVDLAPIPGPQIQLEHVIPFRRAARHHHTRASWHTLATQALYQLRQSGYEAELHLQGTFRRSLSSRPLVLDMLLEGWTLDPDGLSFDPPLGYHWQPCPALSPRPVLLIRGVAHQHSKISHLHDPAQDP